MMRIRNQKIRERAAAVQVPGGEFHPSPPQPPPPVDGAGGQAFTFDPKTGQFVPSHSHPPFDGAATLHNPSVIPLHVSVQGSQQTLQAPQQQHGYAHVQGSGTRALARGEEVLSEPHWFFFRIAAPLDMENEVSVPYDGEETFLVAHHVGSVRSHVSSRVLYQSLVPPLTEPTLQFEPSSDDEIAVSKGDLVHVHQVFRDGWLAVSNVDTGAYGMVPTDAVKLGVAVPPGVGGGGVTNFGKRMESRAGWAVPSRGVPGPGSVGPGVGWGMGMSSWAGAIAQSAPVGGLDCSGAPTSGGWPSMDSHGVPRSGGFRSQGSSGVRSQGSSSRTVVGSASGTDRGSRSPGRGKGGSETWSGAATVHAPESIAHIPSAHIDVRGAVARSSFLATRGASGAPQSRAETVRLQSAHIDVRGPVVSGSGVMPGRQGVNGSGVTYNGPV
ncbi:hypothetical protein M427DRAFT_144736 [Gonapodya prolifera JEL478]|uniref:SH3 domain-containing protein n=1 Tax=Gonapodya prolifera (strain JEL478) TaxID=1344416 RepID=A0A139AIU2_GONPJ|nr:hypothetical protein M427DRAFT_144736 [Gonapodya prolifera JEL478]|eukprot:KXS16722.1 hypothetical protein M427DRAFT_144736 [Gonapodya prolifera JEL478]